MHHGYMPRNSQRDDKDFYPTGIEPQAKPSCFGSGLFRPHYKLRHTGHCRNCVFQFDLSCKKAAEAMRPSPVELAQAYIRVMHNRELRALFIIDSVERKLDEGIVRLQKNNE